MALMTYLCKDRHGTYHFRRVIPPALRPFMPSPWTGKANYKLNLRTKKPAEAKARASRIFPGWAIHVSKLRNGKISWLLKQVVQSP